VFGVGIGGKIEGRVRLGIERCPDEQKKDIGDQVDKWVGFIIEGQRRKINRNHELTRLLRESEADRLARLELLDQRGGEILALREQIELLEDESGRRLELLDQRGGEILALREQIELLKDESGRRLELLDQRGGEILALREQIELLKDESGCRLELLEQRGGEILALREQVEMLEGESSRRLELIHQRGGEIFTLWEQIKELEAESKRRLEFLEQRGCEILALREHINMLEAESRRRSELIDQRGCEILALRQQIDSIHQNAFEWLLTCFASPPGLFDFIYPPQPNMISAIIPAYNAEAFLERCVQSVWDQQLQGWVLEIVLCDDGSTDGTLKLARSLASRSPVPMQVLHHPTDRIEESVLLVIWLYVMPAAYLLRSWMQTMPGFRIGCLCKLIFCPTPRHTCVCSWGYNRDLQGNLVPGWNGTHIAGDYGRVPPPNDFPNPLHF
jgi:predicted nuclease with TOPRIM domain